MYCILDEQCVKFLITCVMCIIGSLPKYTILLVINLLN